MPCIAEYHAIATWSKALPVNRDKGKQNGRSSFAEDQKKREQEFLATAQLEASI